MNIVKRILLEFEVDNKYWRILPAIDINLHGDKWMVEVGWACIVMYVNYKDLEKENKENYNISHREGTSDNLED